MVESGEIKEMNDMLELFLIQYDKLQSIRILFMLEGIKRHKKTVLAKRLV